MTVRKGNTAFHEPPSRTVPRALVYLATLLAVVSYLLLALARPVAADPLPGGDSPSCSGSTTPCLTIDSLSPEILTDETEITVSVSLAGFSGSQSLRLVVVMQADPFETAAEVDSFLSAGRSDGWSAKEQALTAEQMSAAGTPNGTSLTFSMKESDTPLWNENAWGPYGVTVRLVDGWGDPVVSAEARTLLLWYPPGSSGHTELNVLLSNLPEVPSEIVKEASRLGVTPALSPSGIRSLLDTTPKAGLEVVSLPASGASLSLLATAGLENLYQLAKDSRLTKEEAGNLDLVQDVLVADEDWMGLRTVRAAQGEAVLSPPSGIGAPTGSLYTATSVLEVDPETGQSVVDVPLSPTSAQETAIVLDSWAAGASALSEEDRNALELSQLTGRQRARAFTAMATQEDPEDTLYLWVNADALSLGRDPSARLNELLDAPWIVPTSLRGLLRSEPSEITRSPLHDVQTQLASATAEQLSPLEQNLVAAQDVLSAAPAGTSLDLETVSSVLGATQTALTPSDRRERVEAAVSSLQEVADVITILPSSTVNVMGRNAPFPVSVANSGTVPLSLMVGLETSDSRLSADHWETAVVPAGGSVTLQIPVQAVGAGRVDVHAVAKAESGVTLDVSSVITVNVRADWEDTGTWIVGSILVALFIVGVIRAIRRGRRRTGLVEQGGDA